MSTEIILCPECKCAPIQLTIDKEWNIIGLSCPDCGKEWSLADTAIYLIKEELNLEEGEK